MCLATAISHEGDWFVARCLEVEATSQSHSIDAARTNFADNAMLIGGEPTPQRSSP